MMFCVEVALLIGGIDLDASSTLAFWAVMFCAEIAQEYSEEDRLTRKCIFRVLLLCEHLGSSPEPPTRCDSSISGNLGITFLSFSGLKMPKR